jgi:hypothetical protein
MLQAKCQTPLAKATAELMGAWALAASQPAIQTLIFWTRVLRSSLFFPAVVHSKAMPGRVRTEEPEPPQLEEKQQPTPNEVGGGEPGFSSYRSSSGHAVAQIVVPEAN